MNLDVSALNPTLNGEGGRGGERTYRLQNVNTGLLSKTVGVPNSFESDCIYTQTYTQKIFTLKHEKFEKKNN